MTQQQQARAIELLRLASRFCPNAARAMRTENFSNLADEIDAFVQEVENG